MEDARRRALPTTQFAVRGERGVRLEVAGRREEPERPAGRLGRLGRVLVPVRQRREPPSSERRRVAQTVAASLQGRVALGPRAGQSLRRLRSAAAARPAGPRCARLEGFSLHADVAVPARRRDQLERVCRYLLRPPLALERLTESSGGQLLVPPPRRPLLAYHGVLASRARWRPAIVPAPREDTRTGGPEDPRGPGRLPWATRLRRVFAIAMLLCPRCGGPRRILGAVTEPAAVRRLLVALGLAAQPPPACPVTAS